MNWNPGPPETNISNFPFNEREIKNQLVPLLSMSMSKSRQDIILVYVDDLLSRMLSAQNHSYQC